MAKSERVSKIKKASEARTTTQPTSPQKVAPASSATFDEKSFPLAVGKLFELNNYLVQYGTQLHGAEIDIIATPKGTPYPQTVYIEATIQYVDNTKYGKDLTKFSLIREVDQNARCICVSREGFTAEVKERAAKTRIITQTYGELFSQFEKFDPYVQAVTTNPSILSLVNSYEQPFFEDEHGKQLANDWLNSWRSNPSPTSRWLIVLGEYGTGKTSLTIAMQYKWLIDYREDADNPIPVRIELRDFPRQFDARSLLHYFLDKNHLSHVPIEFFLYLIRSGRILLILDGYDEMAQFLNARERRACLSALAELSAEGARGILTSRPNYFTITEELNVFDALYTSLEQNKYYLTQVDRMFLEEERSIDSLVSSYVLNRHERYLRDLNQAQTEALVRRRLSGDPIGQDIILNMLTRIFRDETLGSRQSLGGKPVIISYLLEIIDDIRTDPKTRETVEFTEWQVYKLIVDRLMIRDLQRTPTLPPNTRRIGLQRLAILLSGKALHAADEATFLQVIDSVCNSELRRLGSDERRSRRDELFQNFRSSATLTRSESGNFGWIFSHNSLREYLVAEYLVGMALRKMPTRYDIPISSAMRTFVASLPSDTEGRYKLALRDMWQARVSAGVDIYLSLAWELLRRSEIGLLQELRSLGGEKDNDWISLNAVALDHVEISANEFKVSKALLNCNGTSITEASIIGLDLTGSNFSNAILDRVVLRDCNLENCRFSGCLLFECEMSNVNVRGADFRSVDPDINFLVPLGGTLTALSGDAAVGFLKFHGALTDDVDPYYVYQNHPKFPIIFKICENIQDQRKSQLRGLTQRGVAQSDPPFARAFVEFLERNGIITIDQNNLVSATADGRKQIPLFIDQRSLPSSIESFLSERP